MTSDELKTHAFTKAVFDAACPVMEAEHDHRESKGLASEYPLDEYEFYLLRVGNRLATLLSHCEQLSHAVLFLSNYRQTAAMSRARITRTDHLRYNIENYIIRTQTLYDIVLKLVDSVFHLLNSDSQCRHVTVVNNMKVSRTEIPRALEQLRKRLREFEQARHIIIHRGAYQDEELYRLELYTVVGREENGYTLPAHLAFLPAAQVEVTRQLIKQRKAQYEHFNLTVFEHVSNLLSVLHKRFEEEGRRLRLLTGRSA